MASKIFNALLEEKFEVFKNAFITHAESVFIEKKSGKLIHPGEFGAYREEICKNFLRFFVPQKFGIDSGFAISANDEDGVSTQLDVVIYDQTSTPLIQSSNRQKFYPIETIAAVGEIKSVLTFSQLKEALIKLSNVKKMRENCGSADFSFASESRKEISQIIYGEYPKTQPAYDPRKFPNDQIFTFLICKKFDFDIRKTDLLGALYSWDLEIPHMHNIILSLEDGLISYVLKVDNHLHLKHFPILGDQPLSPHFQGTLSKYSDHLKIFVNSLFLELSEATILFPDISRYVGDQIEVFIVDE